MMLGNRSREHGSQDTRKIRGVHCTPGFKLSTTFPGRDHVDANNYQKSTCLGVLKVTATATVGMSLNLSQFPPSYNAQPVIHSTSPEIYATCFSVAVASLAIVFLSFFVSAAVIAAGALDVLTLIAPSVLLLLLRRLLQTKPDDQRATCLNLTRKQQLRVHLTTIGHKTSQERPTRSTVPMTFL